MESITKNRQDEDTLRRMIEKAYGRDAVPHDDGFAHEMGHGWFNVAYRLRLADGREVVMKIAPPPQVEVMTYEIGAMRSEIMALEMITERTNVPVPTVDFYDDSRTLVDAEWFCMTRMPGVTAGEIDDLTPEQEQRYWWQIGRYNAELCSIVGDSYGRFPDGGYATWREAFSAILEDVLADGERRGVDLGHSYDEVRARVEPHLGALDAVTEPRFCEWDLWASNAMVVGDEVIGIIDHERAFWGDPIFEAGMLFAAVGAPIGEAFLEGWGRGPLTEAELERRKLYAVHLFLIMTIETEFRAHATTDQYDMARINLDAALAALG